MKIRRIACLVVGGIVLFNNLLGEAKMNQVPVEQVETEPITAEKKTEAHKGRGDFETIWRVLVYLVMLGVMGAFFVYYFKRGKISLGVGGVGKGSKLKVAETRALGGKQFLAVVEYENNRILLGVSPGVVQKICDLKKDVKVE